MRRQPLQVVLDANAWRGSRMEPGQAAVFQRDFVIELDQLEEHVADQEH